MSRAAPPFPTNNGGYRRARSPANLNGLPTGQLNGGNGPPTPPLAINRPQARPTTPSSVAGSSKGVSPSPSRPQRSDRRPRQESQYSSRSAAISENMNVGSSSERRRYDSEATVRRDDLQMSPTSPALSAVAAAFQSAGASRRAVRNGDVDRGKEREREMAKEKERQKRIRDKVQGRRVNGKGRAGDIDGVCIFSLGRDPQAHTVVQSRAGSDHGRVGIYHRPGCKLLRRPHCSSSSWFVSSSQWTWPYLCWTIPLWERTCNHFSKQSVCLKTH
jgi:hypothetical protein